MYPKTKEDLSLMKPSVDQLKELLEWLKVERNIPDQWAYREIVTKDIQEALNNTNQIAANEYKYFRRGGVFPNVSFIQINRNTVFPGYEPESSDFVIFVTKKGIGINGDCGTNPPADEMRELVMVMDECVKAWQALQSEDYEA
jgi:hypothetical protein